MKRVFLDTNVAIDFLADRKPFSLSAAPLFGLSQVGEIKLYLSAVSYNIIYNILKQSLTPAATLKVLNELCELTEIADVTKVTIGAALKSDWKDFEDAIQYQSALELKKVDMLVTRNTKDFKKAILPVVTPEEALVLLQTKH
ncbi:MAG: PIN domain-containing protein [Chitinophagaceae bacterium]